MLIDRSFAELLDQPGSDPTERRAELRVPLETDVTMVALRPLPSVQASQAMPGGARPSCGEARVLTGLSNDVSMGGMFVTTFVPMLVGARLSLRFRLPTGQVMATGIVRWAREGRPGLIAGMGVEFVDMGELDRAALRRFCGDRPRFLSYQEIVAAAATH
jgi:uncharacterized protein (TIGR02266 family)